MYDFLLFFAVFMTFYWFLEKFMILLIFDCFWWFSWCISHTLDFRGAMSCYWIYQWLVNGLLCAGVVLIVNWFLSQTAATALKYGLPGAGVVLIVYWILMYFLGFSRIFDVFGVNPWFSLILCISFNFC